SRGRGRPVSASRRMLRRGQLYRRGAVCDHATVSAEPPAPRSKRYCQTGRTTRAPRAADAWLRYLRTHGVAVHATTDAQARPVPAQDRVKTIWKDHASPLAARRSRMAPAELGSRRGRIAEDV